MTDRQRRKQASFKTFRHAIALVPILALSLVLSGCGKKASVVDPPPEVENDTFPQTYPDPATDPKP